MLNNSKNNNKFKLDLIRAWIAWVNRGKEVVVIWEKFW